MLSWSKNLRALISRSKRTPLITLNLQSGKGCQKLGFLLFNSQKLAQRSLHHFVFLD